jgi:hypothetical protein
MARNTGPDTAFNPLNSQKKNPDAAGEFDTFAGIWSLISSQGQSRYTFKKGSIRRGLKKAIV